ncbi:MAG: tyrosine--tRNA ligase [bacterium]|nr:tyrosine--tRNA ligase [bacterium]
MNFFGKKEVSTDSGKINELLTRGVERIYPAREALEARLKSGERLSLYYGIDPTGPTLHLGHAVNLLKLKQFQELGHEVIILYGGFTAQIGDPTDKLSARQPLTPAQIKKNTAQYRTLIGKILDVRGTHLKFLDNEEWSNKLKPADFLKLVSLFTVSQLLERDMFQERIKQGKEIHGNEFLYPVFQAYDAVTMDVDIQLGGNDQTFNMLAGRTLMRKMKNKEKFVMVMKLLVDPTGKKMGKSEGNMVTLEDSAEDMYGKIMSWPDGMILPGFELLTTVPLSSVVEIGQELSSGKNPRDLKARLAREVVALYYGAKAGEKAEAEFTRAFRDKAPTEFVDVVLRGRGVVEALMEKEIISSKSDLRRLIDEGAVSKLPEGEKVGVEFMERASAGEYRLGKHRFVRIR